MTRTADAYRRTNLAVRAAKDNGSTCLLYTSPSPRD